MKKLLFFTCLITLCLTFISQAVIAQEYSVKYQSNQGSIYQNLDISLEVYNIVITLDTIRFSYKSNYQQKYNILDSLSFGITLRKPNERRISYTFKVGASNQKGAYSIPIKDFHGQLTIALAENDGPVGIVISLAFDGNNTLRLLGKEVVARYGKF